MSATFRSPQKRPPASRRYGVRGSLTAHRTYSLASSGHKPNWRFAGGASAGGGGGVDELADALAQLRLDRLVDVQRGEGASVAAAFVGQAFLQFQAPPDVCEDAVLGDVAQGKGPANGMGAAHELEAVGGDRRLRRRDVTPPGQGERAVAARGRSLHVGIQSAAMLNPE